MQAGVTATLVCFVLGNVVEQRLPGLVGDQPESLDQRCVPLDA